MYVLTDRWTGPHLDPHARPGDDLRIQVEDWCLLGAVRGQYIERRAAPGMVWHYARRVGVRAVARKIRSRLRERVRNRKYVAIGRGRVLSDDGELGRRVWFLACNHPRCADRVVVDRRFAVEAPTPDAAPADGIRFADLTGRVRLPDALGFFAGWSPHSGIAVGEAAVAAALEQVADRIRDALAAAPVVYPPFPTRPIIGRDPNPASGDGAVDPARSHAVLFGFGNYAKTIILPYWSSRVPVTRIHEIDPLQLGAAAAQGAVRDTSPYPRPDETATVWLVAGYHHTHTDIAIRALERGRVAVVEKPLCTTLQQFEALRDAYRATPGGALFACFQKRYAVWNDWAVEDLAVRRGDAIDYHCIVYEIPLPPLHWYNWPASGSRLISNGCHWIDHFMYLNAYARPERYDVFAGAGGTTMVAARLENGATFSMVLTDVGSERIGVQDHIELRAGSVTVRIRDGAAYEAESTRGILRRRNVNPLDAYRRMYRLIGERARRGTVAGDSLESLRSAELTLLVEEALGAVDRREIAGH